MKTIYDLDLEKVWQLFQCNMKYLLKISIFNVPLNDYTIFLFVNHIFSISYKETVSGNMFTAAENL